VTLNSRNLTAVDAGVAGAMFAGTARQTDEGFQTPWNSILKANIWWGGRFACHEN
jgi:hypothetical protein